MSDNYPGNPGNEGQSDNPYGQQPSYGDQSAYGQSGSYGQSPYGGAPNGGPAQKHPNATTSLVLGILGIICCSIAAPFAWFMGKKAVDEIDANPGRYEGRDLANIGKILGIIGTVLMVLGILFGIVMLATGSLFANMETNTTTDWDDSTFQEDDLWDDETN